MQMNRRFYSVSTDMEFSTRVFSSHQHGPIPVSTKWRGWGRWWAH